MPTATEAPWRRFRPKPQMAACISSAIYITFAISGLSLTSPAVAASPCGLRVTDVAMSSQQPAVSGRDDCAGSGHDSLLTMSGLDVGTSTPAYGEDGYILSARVGLRPCDDGQKCIFAARDQQSKRTLAFPGSESLNFNVAAQSQQTFRVRSLKIRNPDRTTQSIMFVGKLPSGSTTAYAVTVRGNMPDLQTFIFPDSFGDVVSVSWSPKGTQVTDIRLTH